ncbi:MAG: transporter substrate-binding domain-containing protein [Polaromonas sp.]
MKFDKQSTLRGLALGVGLACIGLAAQADMLTDVQKARKVRVAIDLGSPPFGTTDGAMKPTGSDVDTAQLLARDLGVELEIVQTTGANRIPFLQTQKADLVISSLSVTPERERVIDFSAPYADIRSVVAAPKSFAIKGMADLAGKRVAVARGTTNDKLLTDAKSGAEVVRFDDDATQITAVTTGQVEIFVTSPAIVKTIVAKAPKLEVETKFVIKTFPLGIGIRKGEPKMLAWVNEWITKNSQNGKLAEIYKKYHGG